MAVSLTPGQRQAVEHAGKPLFIQAGAGTGKTFTLTKKLAYGLSPVSGPIAPSVENILIITFTNKAAGELLGRVRGELRAQRLDEAALAIDGAWISTIHAMCQALLSAHALEAHVDPGTDLLDEEQSEAWLKQSVDMLLGNARSYEVLVPLMEAYGVGEACALLEDLARIIELTPGGADGLARAPGPQGDPSAELRRILPVLEGCLQAVELQGIKDESSEASARQHGRLAAAVEVVRGLAASEMLSWGDLAAALETCEVPRGGSLKKVYREDFACATDALVGAYAAASAARASEHLDTALYMARGVAERHRAMKRAAGAQDVSDLLMGAYELLRCNPALAAEYQKRFDMVMVDEFQDTDSLQVKIVESLCGQGLSSLTTVGDAQQSIYGFRGADLETYRETRAAMARLGSTEVELDTNYRSHPDILAFVESIFSKETFFGNEFLRIGAGPSNSRDYAWAAADAPRVSIMVAAGEKGDRGGTHTSSADLRVAEASMIAERFERLHSDGAPYGSMAILMRSTRKAGAYLDALRSRGIPCAIYGGSDFYIQPEVRLLTDFLRVLAFPDDDEALLRLLGSPMFDVSDSGLLALRLAAKRWLDHGPEDARPRPSLFDALMCKLDEESSRSEGCRNAAEVLGRALAGVGALPASQLVERVVWESGWMAELQRQGAQGIAVCANVERFEDILDSLLDTRSPSIVAAAEYFCDMCERAESGRGARGKPGKMVTGGNDAVMVMTIHASKGLEFPIVAVAQYTSSWTQTSARPFALTEAGRQHLVMPMLMRGSVGSLAKEHMEALGDEAGSFADAAGFATFNAYGMRLKQERDKEEEQRLLYVALTRARDVLLLVSNDWTFASNGKLRSGLFADVVEAVLPDGLPQSFAMRRLDTGCLVEVIVQNVPFNPASTAREDDSKDETYSAESGVAPRVHLLPAPAERAAVLSRMPVSRQIMSYTALSRGAGHSYLPQFITLKQRAGQSHAAKLGSAFHLVAEWMAANPSAQGIDTRIAAAAKRYGLEGDDALRLGDAVRQWEGSNLLARARSFACVLPEHPFCVRVGGVPVEGFIDLLCLNAPSDRALIVDYKTGESGEEHQLEKRYIGQARTYAFAVMKAGLCQAVDVIFVRPEADLQEVTFSFEADDLDELEELILE